MLAKQAWRIINNPSSLIARIYRAKYFPGGTFWTADAHASPSYSWRSIISTRELILQGSYWQIGDGEQVRVWGDPWVPGIPNNMPTILPSTVNNSLKVSDLLLDSLAWNDALVRSTFSVGDAEAILSIPLSTRRVEDRCVWKLESDGVFSVKTAYRHSFSLSPSRRPNTLNVNSEFWKKIWKGGIPTSVRVHAWRVCNNILPSLERLASKHVQLDSHICVLCETEQECTFHLCRNCPYTKLVLQTNGSISQVCFDAQTEGFGIIEWLSFCAKQLPQKAFEELLYLLWHVWKERNNRVWKQKKSLAIDVALRACAGLAEFRLHNVRVMNMGQWSTLASWNHPPAGILKANCDGSFHSETKKGGLGFVIRDSSGALIAGGAKPLGNLLSAEHAEALACQAALEFARDHSMMPIILETDSILVQRQVSSGAIRNTSLLGRLYEDIVEVMNCYPNVSILHTRRGANLVAHLTADYAKSLRQESFFFSIPSFLVAAVAADCRAL